MCFTHPHLFFIHCHFLELLKVGQIPQRRIFRIIVSDQMPFLSPNQAVSKHCRGLTSALGMVIGKHHPFSVNQPVPLMDWMLHFLHWFCSVSIHLHLHYSSLWMWWNLHSRSTTFELQTFINIFKLNGGFKCLFVECKFMGKFFRYDKFNTCRANSFKNSSKLVICISDTAGPLLPANAVIATSLFHSWIWLFISNDPVSTYFWFFWHLHSNYL